MISASLMGGLWNGSAVRDSYFTAIARRVPSRALSIWLVRLSSIIGKLVPGRLNELDNEWLASLERAPQELGSSPRLNRIPFVRLPVSLIENRLLRV